VLQSYFSGRAISGSSHIDLFPQQEVYDTVKVIVGNTLHEINWLPGNDIRI
jgi:hypothetical protein